MRKDADYEIDIEMDSHKATYALKKNYHSIEVRVYERSLLYITIFRKWRKSVGESFTAQWKSAWIPCQKINIGKGFCSST